MPRLELIDSLDDPRIEPYREVRERDLVGRQGLFIAEGEVVLRHLVAGGRFAMVSALVDSKRLEKLAPMFAQLADEVPVFHARREVLDGIAGFPMHRGILGLGRRDDSATVEQLLANQGPAALLLVLYDIANHDNLGAIFRNAAAFGVGGVILDAHCCDPLYRKALRVSVGAALIVPFARLAPGEDALALLARHGFEAIALTPGGGERLSDLRRAGRMAVLLGAEGPGVPGEVIARARAVGVTMAPGFDSLNVATTSGIVLHHLAAQIRS
ncbi:MAG TPA: RNA methyltransferase [Caulobacteraceae bacterium]